MLIQVSFEYLNVDTINANKTNANKINNSDYKHEEILNTLLNQILIYTHRAWLDELDRAARQNKEPSLGWALFRAYWLEYMPGAIYILVIVTCRLVKCLYLMF